MKRNKIVTAVAAASVIMCQQVMADVVHLDDTIIDGSLCAGSDCVNGESFGFDTLRFKENNLRIHFDDTSGTGSFPSNDWRITINDSANGGASKFAIDDVTAGATPFTIRAGAGNNAIYVDGSGKVGLGTASPSVELHLADGDSPSFRLEQNGSSGFTPQAWDIAGNETNFFVRDVTNGSKLPFKILPGADDNTLVLTASSQIGIGTNQPNADLEVRSAGSSATIMARYPGGGGSYGEFIFNEGGDNRWSMGSVGGNDYYYIYNYTNSRTDLSISDADGYLGLGGVTAPTYPIHHSNGGYLSTGGTWTNASSRALKHDVQELPLTVAMATLDELKPVTFRYNSAPQDETVGFIAEDVPELVATPDHKGLSPMDIVAVLTRVVKQQQAMIDQQQTQMDKLEKMVMSAQNEQ